VQDDTNEQNDDDRGRDDQQGRGMCHLRIVCRVWHKDPSRLANCCDCLFDSLEDYADNSQHNKILARNTSFKKTK